VGASIRAERYFSARPRKSGHCSPRLIILDIFNPGRNMKSFAVILFSLLSLSSAFAESDTEKKCASGTCTCSYIASTCKKWNTTHGGDLAICDTYKQSCLSSGRWDDR